MPIFPRFLLLAALGLPATLLAQTWPAPDSTRTEPDQELDNFSGQFEKLHVFSARLRGVRAARRTVYWISADNQQLTAYQAGRVLWTTNVVAPFKAEIPTAHIVSVALAANIIFVNLGKRGMVEVDRQTGRIVAKYFDRDSHNLVAD